MAADTQRRGWAERAQNRWVWAGFAMPGIIWLVLLFIVPFYVVLAIAGGELERGLPVAGPGVESAPLDRRQLHRRLPRPGGTDGLRRADLPAHPGLRGRGLGAVAPDRLSGRLLRDPVRRPPQGGLPGAADRPVLDQLHDADAGLDRPPPDRWLRQPGAPRPPRGQPAGRLARGQVGDRHPRAGLRLHPLPDPGALRRDSTGSTNGSSRPAETSASAGPARSFGSPSRSAARRS